MADRIPTSMPLRPKPDTSGEAPDARPPTAAPSDLGRRIPANNTGELLHKLVYSAEDAGLETLGNAFHTWQIKDWDKLPETAFGPVFQCSGSPWTVKLLPGKTADRVSLFLQPAYDSSIPKGWYACVRFAFVIWNPNSPLEYVSKAAHHRFNEDDPDWGFSNFCDLQAIRGKGPEAAGSLLQEGKINITTYVRVVKDPTGYLWYNFYNYDSKAATGMVGLRNEVATDYLNCILQILYHLTAFREAIYRERTTEVDENDIIPAFQRLFYLLQTSSTPVSTREFMDKAFGWSSSALFGSHMVQEYSDILLSRAAETMVVTPLEDMETLFMGDQRVIQSGAVQPVIDIKLDVQGHSSLENSLNGFTQKPPGNNALPNNQNAGPCILFDILPHVLQLTLKRVVYDPTSGLRKINDYMEFPEELNMTPYITKSSVDSEPFIYSLFGVIVHYGNSFGGHYYCFLRPKPHGRFYKFDDERVIPASFNEALQDNFGTNEAQTQSSKSATATMLIYIRESNIHDVLKYLPESTIPTPIREKYGDHKTTIAPNQAGTSAAADVYIITEKTFQTHHGLGLTDTEPRSGDSVSPRVYPLVPLNKSLGDFTKQIANDHAVGNKPIGLWPLKNNRSYGPGLPDMVLGKIIENYRVDGGKLQFWLDDTAAAPNTILLFLKRFNAETETLTGFKCIRIHQDKQFGDLSSIIRQALNWPADAEIIYFKETQLTTEHMETLKTFKETGTENGDIIWFQRQPLTAKQLHKRLLDKRTQAARK